MSESLTILPPKQVDVQPIAFGLPGEATVVIKLVLDKHTDQMDLDVTASGPPNTYQGARELASMLHAVARMIEGTVEGKVD